MFKFFKSKKNLRKSGNKLLSQQLNIKRYKGKKLEKIEKNKNHIRCDFCKKKVVLEEVVINNYICTICDVYFRITPNERISLTFDSFEEKFKNIKSANPLNIPEYDEKLKNLEKQFDVNSAVTAGVAKINNNKFMVFILNPFFIMGSLGSSEGEKIFQTFKYAIKNKLSVVGFISSGGARMQEGMFSLMQMAKTSAIISEFNKDGLFYLSILTSPTFGGVTASFATLGDIIVSEPKAKIGFAGRRVIEQTAKIKLPANFQSAEFLKEKGFIDLIIKRKNMKATIANLLKLHNTENR